jgi:hypothetical protein
MYEHYRVHVGKISGDVWALTGHSDQAVMDMMDELSRFTT